MGERIESTLAKYREPSAGTNGPGQSGIVTLIVTILGDSPPVAVAFASFSGKHSRFVVCLYRKDYNPQDLDFAKYNTTSNEAHRASGRVFHQGPLKPNSE
jgi:hypothetical protein